MPQAPLYTTWLIHCRDAAAAAQLGCRLTERVNLDRVVEDVVRTVPGGVEHCQVVPHRLGDYFAAIQLLPVVGDAAAWQLMFARRLDAGRYWKDLMVNVVQEVERTAEATAVRLAYKGYELPTDGGDGK